MNTGTPKPPGSGPGSPRHLPLSAEERSIAVAVDHDAVMDSVPRIIASGRGFVADQILNIAFANGIKVRQDADLAQILSVADLDSEIPVEAFAAVAELLVYVYQANRIPEYTDPPSGGMKP